MKTYIAIALLEGNEPEAVNLLESLNKILTTPLAKSIYIYDVSSNGAEKEVQKALREYQKLGVFLKRVKRAKNKDRNERFNNAIAESILHFNHIQSKTYDTFVHLTCNVSFTAHDLNLLINNARLYNGISPVLTSIYGLEIWDAIFHRYGVTYAKKTNAPSLEITGAIEESYVLNPKCFALSNRYARKFRNFTISEREPVDYLNGLLYSNTDELPKIDTGLFVHENLY